MNSASAPLGFLMGLLLFAPAWAQDAGGWKAGLAQVQITPGEPLFMAGYASRQKPSQGVLADLYAKVLALEDARGRRAVLVTADLIGFRAEFAEPLCRQIMADTGLERAQILLNASHTHTGPLPTLNPEPSGPITAEEARKLVTYTQGLQQKIAAAVSQALQRLEPAQLAWGSGVAQFVMNRREPTSRGIILGVNPRGPADRSVPVLRISDMQGRPRGVLFGAACHNTTLTGDHYEISGDYAGFAQDYIQTRFPSIQAMFMLGCAGDANPYPRGTVEDARNHGIHLGREVCRLLEGELEPVSGPLQVALQNVGLPLQPPPPRSEMEELAARGGWQGFVGRRMLELVERGEPFPRSYTAPVALWQFGQDLTLVGLPGEVVVDYVHLLEEALGPLKLWIAGYCNDVFGYLPSARLLREGGYETRGLIYGGVGFFSPTAQDALVDTVRDLARQMGR